MNGNEMFYEYAVIAGYFLLIIGIGFTFKKMAAKIFGLLLSWLVKDIMTPDVFANWIGREGFTKRESADMSLILTLGTHVFITSSFFWATSFFYKESTDKNRLETARFFENLETEVIADDLQSDIDRKQRDKLGGMVIFMGAGILMMALIPNPLWGRLVFVICSLIICSIGVFLKRNAKVNIN